MNDHDFLTELFSDRRGLFELFIGAVLLALSVNLLASGIAAALKIRPIELLVLSTCLILVAFALISRKLIDKRHFVRRYDGFLVYSKDKNDLIEVPRYDLSERICDYLQAIFAENEAMKKLWNKEPLKGMFKYDAEKRDVTRHPVASTLLVKEAVEYFLLDALSTHLTDYFNHQPFDKELLKEFGREDAPGVLFKNRFLDTFSRPMLDRPTFIDSALNPKRDFGQVVAAFGPNAARYERFDLVLPKEAKVARLADGNVEIDTPKFKMNLSVQFDGLNTVLPFKFASLYLRNKNRKELTVYKLGVRISVTLKRWVWLTRSGWDYHMWIDSFLEAFDHKFSEETFFAKIDWERALTVARLMDGTSIEGRGTSTETDVPV
jgi:hypothetical protein